MIDTVAWHRDLLSGTLYADLDAGSDLDILTLISVVNGVMREKRYLEPTARRVRIILQELLRNVGRHVPDQHARVHVALREDHLRGAVLDVGDNGPGIPNDVLDRYTERLLSGDREHGLLLVSRLASRYYDRPLDVSLKTTNHVGCDIIESRQRSSTLTRNKSVGLVRVEYHSPKVLWIGPEESYVEMGSATSMNRLFKAAEQGWLPVLAPYFGPLLRSSHIAIEVSGYDLASEHGSFFESVLGAITAFFPERISQKRIVLLAPEADPGLRYSVAHSAHVQGLPWFESEAAAYMHLAEQTTG